MKLRKEDIYSGTIHRPGDPQGVFNGASLLHRPTGIVRNSYSEATSDLNLRVALTALQEVIEALPDDTYTVKARIAVVVSPLGREHLAIVGTDLPEPVDATGLPGFVRWVSDTYEETLQLGREDSDEVH